MMNRKIIFLFVLIYLLPIVFSQYYYDQSYSNFIGFNSPFIDLSISGILDFYSAHYEWIDILLVFALIFGFTSKVFEDKFGKGAPFAISLILAIGLGVFERQAGFNLGSFGPVAVLIILLFLLLTVFYLIHWIHNKYNEHERGSKIGLFLFLIAILVVLWILFGDKFGVGNIFGYTPPSLDLIWVALAIAGMAALLYFLFNSERTPEEFGPTREMYEAALRAEQETSSPPDLTRKESEATKASFLLRLKIKKEEDRRYKEVSAFVSTFINLLKEEISEEQAEAKYKETGSIINKFLEDFPKSSYKNNIFHLANQVKEAYNNYKNSRETRQQKLGAAYTDQKSQDKKSTQQKLDEKNEYKRLVVLISDFLSLQKQLFEEEIKQDYFDNRYNATLTIIDEFLKKYPDSSYKSKIIQARTTVIQIYEETIARFNKRGLIKLSTQTEKATAEEETKEDIDFFINYLREILKNIRKYSHDQKQEIWAYALKVLKSYQKSENKDTEKVKVLAALMTELKEKIDNGVKEETIAKVIKRLPFDKEAYDLREQVEKQIEFLEASLNNINRLKYDDRLNLFNESRDLLKKYRLQRDSELYKRLAQLISQLQNYMELNKERPERALKDTIDEDKTELENLIEQVEFTIKNFDRIWDEK